MLSARQFSWWYNGHPDSARLPVDLSRVTSVAVCGIGERASASQALALAEVVGAQLQRLHCQQRWRDAPPLLCW